MIGLEAHGGSARVLRMVLFVLLALLVLTVPLGLRTFAAEETAEEPAAEIAPPSDPADEAESDANEEDTPTPLTFDTPATGPETVADVFGASSDVPGLHMEVFPVDALNYKFTFYGVDGLLTYMREQLKDEDIDYAFRYELRMIAEREVFLKGKITYREPKRGEDARITKISSMLHCKELSYKSKHPRVETDKLSWLITMKSWFGFDLNQVSGFELTVYNAFDSRQKVIFHFEKDAVVTDTMLYTSLRKGGLLRLQVPDENNITITITDPKLRDGYKNSPDEAGAIDPFWHVQGILTARGWVEAKLEGKDGQDIEHMDYYAGEYHRKEDNSNQYNAKSEELSVKSYSIEGNDVIMYFMIPSRTGINLKYIRQVAVDMNNGTVLKNNIYNVY